MRECAYPSPCFSRARHLCCRSKSIASSMIRWASRKSSSFRSRRPLTVSATRRSSTDLRRGQRRVISFGHPFHLEIDVGFLDFGEAEPAIEAECRIVFLDEDADALALAAGGFDQTLEDDRAKALAAI